MLQVVHPGDSVLESYCMNRLEGEALDAFEEHLLLCANCQDRVSDTDGFLRGMRSALAANETKTMAAGWSLKQLVQFPAPVWATAALAAAGVAGLFIAHDSGVNMPPLAVALSANRGGPAPIARAGRVLDLDLDMRDLSPAAQNRVQVVNSEGKEVWSGNAAPVQNGHVHALVSSALDPGQYYVRLTDARGMHREYGLRVGK